MKSGPPPHKDTPVYCSMLYHKDFSFHSNQGCRIPDNYICLGLLRWTLTLYSWQGLAGRILITSHNDHIEHLWSKLFISVQTIYLSGIQLRYWGLITYQRPDRDKVNSINHLSDIIRHYLTLSHKSVTSPPHWSAYSRCSHSLIWQIFTWS